MRKFRAISTFFIIKCIMHAVFTSKYDKIYFIGIGGVSMSALAKYLKITGKTVAGSDICESVFTRSLQSLGIAVETGDERGSVKDFDLIVYTDAVRENDRQLCEAVELGKPVISRGQLLYEVSRTFGTVIAVSGCHGKTTCTSMLAHIFSAAKKKFCAHIGGNDCAFSNSYYCGDDYFITEACEYKKNFLLLKPHIAVVLNSDADHLECYGNAEKLKRAYAEFADGADIAVSLYKDGAVEGGITFGYDKNARFNARNIKNIAGIYSFSAYEGDNMLGNVRLNVYGKHNILNALAAIAVARSAGIDFCDIAAGLADFCGVERRFEKIGYIGGVNYFADYAHHPTEIRATLRTARKITRGRLFIVFQPHTYSRTKNLFKQFVRALSMQNNLLIYRTYAAREYFDDAGSALTLSNAIKKSRYGECERDIVNFISRATEGDTVIFLGAGDIYDIAKNIVRNLSARP